MSQSSLQPLSVGNVVDTAFQLYKNRFKSYFLLALKAYFRLLIPIYGWAKFSAISALISRLVYGELVNQPETVTAGTRYVNSKLWQLLIAFVYFIFIALIMWIVLLFASVIFLFIVVIAVISRLFPLIQIDSVTTTAVTTAIASAISTVGVIVFLIHFFIFELPLVTENNTNVTSSIRRSKNLFKSFISHILKIYFVTFLTTLPLLGLLESIYFLIFRSFSGQSLLAYPLGFLMTLAAISARLIQLFSDSSIDQKQILNLLLWTFILCFNIGAGAIQ